MKMQKQTIAKIEKFSSLGYEIIGSGIGYGAHWANRNAMAKNVKAGREVIVIACTNDRKCGYTRRIIWAVK